MTSGQQSSHVAIQLTTCLAPPPSSKLHRAFLAVEVALAGEVGVLGVCAGAHIADADALVLEAHLDRGIEVKV
jgi:hypothetical protein